MYCFNSYFVITQNQKIIKKKKGKKEQISSKQSWMNISLIIKCNKKWFFLTIVIFSDYIKSVFRFWYSLILFLFFYVFLCTINNALDSQRVFTILLLFLCTFFIYLFICFSNFCFHFSLFLSVFVTHFLFAMYILFRSLY